MDDEKDGVLYTALLLGAFGGAVSLMTQAFFSFLFHTPSLIALLAFLLAILIGKKKESSNPRRISALLIALTGMVVITVGGVLSVAYSHYVEAVRYGDSPESGHGVEILLKASKLALDSELAENAGVAAHGLALRYDSIDQEYAHSLREQAIGAFDQALELNPYSLIGICSKARVMDELGKYQESYPLHLEAVREGKSREFFLRPGFFAARNRVYLAMEAFEKKDTLAVEKYFREALAFMIARREAIGGYKLTEDSVQLRKDLIGWLSYFEGQRLYKEGDRRWKKRDAETGLALMQEAKERYRLSKNFVEKYDPWWEEQWNQLNKNIKLLQGAAITPAQISPEEIEQIAKGLKGLDTPAEKR